MTQTNEKPLIVQGDGSLLLEVHNPYFDNARADIRIYAELEKSPEHIHSYRLTHLSLWNAAGTGWTADKIIESLNKWSRYPVPANTIYQIEESLSRWGLIKLLPSDQSPTLLKIEISNEHVYRQIEAKRSLNKLIEPSEGGFILRLFDRGTVKSELMDMGFPVMDMVPLKKGGKIDINLRPSPKFKIREYQKDAIKAFLGQGEPGTGFGTIVMPCGSGKTIVGLSIMARLSVQTLILTTNIAAVHQWQDELLQKTTLEPEQIAEYTGTTKGLAPVTIATYQVIVWSPDKRKSFPNFDLFHKNPWGLIIYDEVHLLPASVFRVTAEIQAIKRLGLTATLIREDGLQNQVFCLVGPKRYDIPWKKLEEEGWIASAECREIRLDLPREKHLAYAMASQRNKIRIAAENPLKIAITEKLIFENPDDQILVIGQYISQLKSVSSRLKAPIITGQTPNKNREELYERFRNREHRILVVSKVANFAIDLPEASMAVQLSGAFGSRQEEAQRLGRILRPGKSKARFFSLVTRASIEEKFAANRQRFLTEQGYQYEIEVWT